MLYRCQCELFNRKNNSYRKDIHDIVFLHIINMLKNNKINKIGICFFEPGGLLDEYKIIKKLNEYIIKYNLVVKLDIYIIEKKYPYDTGKAYSYFYKKILKYFFVTIYNYSQVCELRERLYTNHFDYLVIISIDPYYYTYYDFFKNEIEDVYQLSKIIPFGLQIILHATKYYFYSVRMSVFFFNSRYYQDYFLECQYFGNQKEFLLVQQFRHYLKNFQL